jgi:hypothetical protein
MVVRRALRAPSLPYVQIETAQPAVCPLCGRPMNAGDIVDEHHLIPKSKGGREKFLVHKLCHKTIHATLTETQLARTYHTWEALRAQPEIARFIAWVQNKPTALMVRTRRRS